MKRAFKIELLSRRSLLRSLVACVVAGFIHVPAKRRIALARLRCDFDVDALTKRLATDFATSLFGLSFEFVEASLDLGVLEAADSSRLLQKLSTRIRPEWDRLLVLTDDDLSYPGQTFVFGAADEQRRVAVISLYRMRILPADNKVLLERTAKETAHELGHTYGLRHCTSRSCVMAFSSTVEQIDTKGSTFCPVHAEELVRRLG